MQKKSSKNKNDNREPWVKALHEKSKTIIGAAKRFCDSRPEGEKVAYQYLSGMMVGRYEPNIQTLSAFADFLLSEKARIESAKQEIITKIESI